MNTCNMIKFVLAINWFITKFQPCYCNKTGQNADIRDVNTLKIHSPYWICIVYLQIYQFFLEYSKMAKDLLRIIFSSANVVHYVYIIYFTNGLKIPGHRHNAFGGQWKFLTYWNLWLQLTYFIISLLSWHC